MPNPTYVPLLSTSTTGDFTVGGNETVTGNETVSGNSTIGGNLTVTGQETISGTINTQPATSAATALSVNVNTSSFDEMRILGDGSYNIGPGTIARDVKFGRTTGGTAKGGFVTSNLQVGAAADLGDDGVGELKLANATTVPTTNPTGGTVIYSRNGGVFARGSDGTVEPLGMGNRVGSPMPLALTETANRNTVSSTFTPTSGTLAIYSVFLQAGSVVNKIGFCTSTTAASGPTHWWTALLDNTYKQQAHSADQLTTALPASTWQNLTMVTPYVATYTGTYYLAILVTTSTTQPTLISNAATFASQFLTGTNVPTPLIGGQSSTGLTVPGTDNSTTYIAPTAATNTPYMYSS